MGEHDAFWMRRALEIGRRGRFWSGSNPSVGCLLVRDGEVLAEGFTHPEGHEHAEVHALKQVADATNATAYVTLEPCAHTGRTGPCVEALIDAGVSRVVIGLQDPDPRVSGRGIRRLIESGIQVSVGVEEALCEEALRGFLLRIKRGWGRVRVKVGMSSDGRTAMASGESQWITGPDARRDVQVARAESDAILTGVGTVLADNCALTLRQDDWPSSEDDWARASDHGPIRVVLDSQGRIPSTARILSADAPTFVLTASESAAERYTNGIAVASDGEQLDLSAVLTWLGQRGCNDILVEAGSTLVGSLVAQDLIDEWLIYQAPMLLGSTSRPVHSADFDALADASRYVFMSHDLIGDDLRIIMRRRG